MESLSIDEKESGDILDIDEYERKKAVDEFMSVNSEAKLKDMMNACKMNPVDQYAITAFPISISNKIKLVESIILEISREIKKSTDQLKNRDIIIPEEKMLDSDVLIDDISS